MGLGNPGPEYASTRHNVGFLVLEEVARRSGATLDQQRFHGYFGSGWSRCAAHGLDGPEGDAAPVGLLCPHTYMNRSGRAVAAALDAHPELDPRADLLVVYDDLDLPLGRLRLRPSGGAGGHNGLADVIEAVGDRAVPRLRVGIDRPPPGQDPIEYVLAPFDAAQQRALPGLLARAADAVELALALGVRAAMTEVNRAPEVES
ncbi:MAG: aminoacyl-tRNA hydrolase [Myxococcota bacterium]